jgi:hypothetical protein
MNTCKKCSSPVPEEKAFCPNCGAPMIEERERVTETVEGMGETMYEYQPPAQKLEAPMVPVPSLEEEPVAKTPKPAVETATSPKTAAKESLQRKPKAAATVVAPKAKAKETAPAVGSNRTLHLILGAAVALFALSILVVAILYFMGKI